MLVTKESNYIMEDTLLDSKAAAAFLGITVANLLMRKIRMEDLQKMIGDDVKKQDLIHDMLNIKEAAVFLGISENVLRLRKVNKWCKLVPVKIGNRIYFRKDDLVKILRE